MSPLDGIYRSTRLGGQSTSPRDKKGYHGITSILNYNIWSCLIYSNIPRSHSGSNTNGQTGEQWRRIPFAVGTSVQKL